MIEMMKYIIFEDRGKLIPILFSNCLRHSDVADNLKKEIGRGDPEIISAGFVRTKEVGNLECFGESTSLGLTARKKEDTAIIEKILKI